MTSRSNVSGSSPHLRRLKSGLARRSDDLGCIDELAQWFLIEWLQRDLPDVTATWEDPDAIVEAEREAYEAITCSPVYEMLAKRDKILCKEPQRLKCPEPDVGPPRMSRAATITSHFRNQEDFLSEVLHPTLFQPKEAPHVPVLIGPQGERILLMVHLFAGRRRVGDFHWWMDQIADQWFPGYHIWVASYDTAIDPVLGNLTGATMSSWHLEPPAELKARWPRPLRSQASFWGIPDRRMGRAARGRANFTSTTLATWSTQVPFGAPTVKPTVIRAMGTQEAKYEMHRHYLGGIQKPTKKLSGIDDTGQFCTAAAKEYPTAMSKGLAFSVAKTLACRLKQGQRFVQHTEIGPLFAWVSTMCVVSKDIRHDAVMMPDYQR
eukprot:symbB.v1.2.016392.t1/scaffold1246.1/size129174/9